MKYDKIFRSGSKDTKFKQSIELSLVVIETDVDLLI